MTIEAIRVMADYNSWALWVGIDNTRPVDVGLSSDLSESLDRWAQVYSSTLDQTYPPDSGFTTKLERELWVRWGLSLTEQVANQLGREVAYCHDVSDQSGGHRIIVTPTKTTGNL